MGYFEMANEQYMIKNYEKAIDLYRKAACMQDNEASSLYNCAVCHIKLNSLDEAIFLLKKALNKKIDSKYYFNLGYCFNAKGDLKKALVYFNRAWSLKNDDEDCKKAIDYILHKIKIR